MNEKWTIENWEEFREALRTMKPRSKLYETIKAELVQRGRWKKLTGRKSEDADKS
jgi:hypothetical protein